MAVKIFFPFFLCSSSSVAALLPHLFGQNNDCDDLCARTKKNQICAIWDVMTDK